MKSFFKIGLVVQTVLIAVLSYFTITLFFQNKRNSLEKAPLQITPNHDIDENIYRLSPEENAESSELRVRKASTFIENLSKIDEKLKLVSYYEVDFKESELYRKLMKYPSIRIYTLLEFSEAISYKTLYKLERIGFTKIPNLKDEKYLGNFFAVFYTSFNNLKKSFRYSKITNGFILENYTAKGVYKLGIRTDKPKENITFRVSAPFSKTGKEIIAINSRFQQDGDENNLIDKRVDQNEGIITTRIHPREKITFLSEIKYAVSLKKSLNDSIYLSGKGVYLTDYVQQMEEEHSQLYETFTSYSEKVVPSSYIDSIARQLDRRADLTGIWKQITRILNKDIRYDWKKRDLFFNGNLTYNNIKDMYMTAEELGNKKVGACPERTSLEISLLRQLGIAARSSTRLYHIFTEIYIPKKGWITTSTTLNEIPLCSSKDEKIAYFIDWSPNHPIRLKWEGYLYPLVITEYFNQENQLKKKLASSH